VHCDASAAIGIVNRTGVGRLRHIRVQYLWLQDKVRQEEIAVRKIKGTENPADLLTKHVPAELIERHCVKLGMERLSSRAVSAPKLVVMMDHGEAEDDKNDHWEDKAERGILTRIHSKWRRDLFTPLRVQGAPPAKALVPCRITEGEFEDGSRFRRADSWHARSTAHLNMGKLWRGSTQFIYKKEE